MRGNIHVERRERLFTLSFLTLVAGSAIIAAAVGPGALFAIVLAMLAGITVISHVARRYRY